MYLSVCTHWRLRKVGDNIEALFILFGGFLNYMGNPKSSIDGLFQETHPPAFSGIPNEWKPPFLWMMHLRPRPGQVEPALRLLIRSMAMTK